MALADSLGTRCAYLNPPPGARTATINSPPSHGPCMWGERSSSSRDLRDNAGRLAAQVKQTQAVLLAAI